jgi:hypothetical protein
MPGDSLTAELRAELRKGFSETEWPPIPDEPELSVIEDDKDEVTIAINNMKNSKYRLIKFRLIKKENRWWIEAMILTPN